jgi:hypothetical protein
MLIFKTVVNGIPCHCRVSRYNPGLPDKVSGAMEDAEEGYDMEFDYRILDHRFILAPWIEKQMDKDDEVRLVEEYKLTLLEDKHAYGIDDYGHRPNNLHY